MVVALVVDKDSPSDWQGPKLVTKGSVVTLFPLFPLPLPLHGGGGEVGGGRGGVPKAKQIGTAGVVHISLLGVKSYDQGKMN